MRFWIVMVLALATSPFDESLFGRFDPSLTRVFTPLHAPSDAYRAYVADARIEDVAARLSRASEPPPPAGAWTIRPAELLEAFGSVPRWDRSRVARLYGGTFPRMARGPLVRQGRVWGSVTLVSPFPDAVYQRLRSGTLVIVTDVSRLQGVTGSVVP